MSEDVFCCVKCWTQYFSCGLCRCFHVYFHNLCFLFSLRFFQITLRFNLKVALQEEIIDECMIFDIHSICVLFYFFCLKLTPVIYIEVYFICLFFNLKEIPVLSCHHWSFCINYESAFLFLILWLLIAFPQTPEITICTWQKFNMDCCLVLRTVQCLHLALVNMDSLATTRYKMNSVLGLLQSSGGQRSQRLHVGGNI